MSIDGTPDPEEEKMLDTLATSDHVTGRELSLAMRYLGSRLTRVEGCIKGLEKKVDPVFTDYEARVKTKTDSATRRWDVKLLLFGGAFGVCFSVVTTAIIFFLRIGG